MRSLKRWLIGLILIAVLLVGMLFSFQNTATAPLDLFIVQLDEQRVSLWILLSFAVGGVSGLLISSSTLIRLKSQTLLLRRKLDKARKDLAVLSNSGIGSSGIASPGIASSGMTSRTVGSGGAKNALPGDDAGKALIKR